MLLPNLERACISVEKLRDYVLNPDHPTGRNKARVFKRMLGIERKHAAAFAQVIKSSLPRAVAEKGKEQSYGSHWVTYHEIIGLGGESVIVTVAWMFKVEEPETPNLITCYIETRRQEQLATLLEQI